jgi:hypothetical protein
MQGMFNSYAAIKTFWFDTMSMDNFRGADATGVATPGAAEVTYTQEESDDKDGTFVTTWSGLGNTTHTLSTDSFY